MVIPELAHFPVDVLYGSGAFRRRLRFYALPGAMVAQVDDSFHSYWLLIAHDGDAITAIDADFLRAPTNMCSGAIGGLAALRGTRLSTPQRHLKALLPQPSNCTHLTDLALWTMAQVDADATWDILIPDAREGVSRITICRDDRLIHQWQIAGFDMVGPQPYGGRPLMRGFMKWASEAFSGDVLLAATMLQRGLFVARGRQHIVDRAPSQPLSSASGMEGSCWSYSAERWKEGHGTVNYVQDFSDAVRPEALPDHIKERLKEAGS